MVKSGNVEMRKVYVDTLMELAEQDRNLVALEADLSGSIGTKRFKEKFPNQYINCGIMEANMAGVAAGLSLTGKRPFLHTFGSFASRRMFDQVFLSLAYAGLSAVILGSDCGVTSEHNGGTHMPFEDIGLMRMIPNCTVVEASDEVMLRKLLLMSYEAGGLWYIRTARKVVPRLYEEDETFELGRGKILRSGEDVLILSCGISAADAYQAAEALSEQGIEAAVVDMFSISHMDQELILRYAKEVKAVVTVENHEVVNGLGTAAAEIIAENGISVKFARLGIKERFGQTGLAEYLKKDYGIDKGAIMNQVIALLE